MTNSHLNGNIENKKHTFYFRVAYKDTDAGEVMYHGNYITWAERARVGLWFLFQSAENSNGEFIRGLEDKGLFVARKVSADYLKPVKLYDEIKIETQVTKWGNSSLTFTQNFFKNEKLMAKVDIVLVYINREKFKPTRLPEYWKNHLQKISSEIL